MRLNISNISKKYYLSIDEMPLNNWMECHKGNIHYIKKYGKRDNDNDLKYWTRLIDQHIDRFGIQDEYKDLMDTQVELAKAQMDYVADENRKALNTIKRLEFKLNKMMVSNGKNIDVDDVLIYLSKFLGYKIDRFTLTVTEYFKMINIYTKANATANKEK